MRLSLLCFTGSFIRIVIFFVPFTSFRSSHFSALQALLPPVRRILVLHHFSDVTHLSPWHHYKLLVTKILIQVFDASIVLNGNIFDVAHW